MIGSGALNRELRAQDEHRRLLALQADLDIAFARLRMAEAEIHGGNGGHASELIAKAILTHKTTVKCLGSVPAGFEETKRELQSSARRLFEAIRRSEREYGVLQVTDVAEKSIHRLKSVPPLAASH